MASSYSRRCKHCQRWISLRQMPHGKWVAFEHNEPHSCEAVPAPPSPRRALPQPAPIDLPDFPDIDIPEEVTAPARPVTPMPEPIVRPSPPRRPIEPPVSPAPRPRPSPPLSPQLRPQPSGESPPPSQRPTIASPVAERAAPSRVRFTDLLAMGAYSFFTIYVMIGVLHSIAFSLFVSRMTCATTTKTIISIFCNTGMGISHLVAVIGWPWYWL
jgi:hypothetical protein